MKNKFLPSYAYILGVLMLFGMYSCQTEPLDAEQDLSSTNSSEMSKTATAKFDWSCGTTATEVNLYAGQHILVGTVKVDIVGDDYKITYNITDGKYCLTSTHLSVVTNPSLFPINKGGNPINGHFEYSKSHDCLSSYTYTVPKSKGTYIAAHAVVNCKKTTTDDTYANLPKTVNFCLRTGREIDNARAYFRADIAEGALTGSYWAWCADVNKSIDAVGENKCYQNFNVLSLNDDLSGIISIPNNIDNTLWLINHVDELLDSGNYLYGNIQWALWKLLNNQECNSCNANLKLPSGDITIKGMELYNLAMANGEGYNPACGENTIAIFDDGINQPVIISIPVTCNEVGDCEETAWAAGCNFPGNNWSTYFKYGQNGG